MKRKIMRLSYLLSLVVLSYWGGRFVHAQMSSALRLPAVTVTYEAKGSSGIPLQLVEAYRADGSKVIAVRRDQKSPPIIEVIDLAARRYFAKDPLTATFDEFPFREELATPTLKRPLNCQEAIGSAGECGLDAGEPTSHLGFAVEWGELAIQGGPVIKAGFAPGLGYLPLVRRSGEATVLVATAVVLGDPAPSLFVLPPDYRKASTSSEFMKQAITARGETTPLNPDTAAQFDEMQRKKFNPR